MKYFIENKKEASIYLVAIAILICIWFLPTSPKWITFILGTLYSIGTLMLMWFTVFGSVQENIKSGKSKFLLKQSLPVFLVYFFGCLYGKSLGQEGIFLFVVGGFGILLSGKLLHQSITLPYIGKQKTGESGWLTGFRFLAFISPPNSQSYQAHKFLLPESFILRI